jgi:transcriptional regulator with XRE-family HTH domain
MAKANEMSAEADTIDRQVGAKIKNLRKHLCFTQEEVAEALGVSYQQIQKYENGKNHIAAGKIYQIAQLLKVPVQSLFPGRQLGEFEPVTTKRLRMMRIVAALDEQHHDDMLRLLRALERMVLGVSSGD